jgi:hypothetical protein
MDPITIIAALVVALLVLALLGQPFLTGGAVDEGTRGSRRAAAVLRERADLLTARNQLYAAIRDLDFDYQTNKVSEEDYGPQRHQLVAQGVEILQQLDNLPGTDDSPEADFIESAVAALHSNGHQATPVAAPARQKVVANAAGFCPNCGNPVTQADKFCGSCGTRL